MHDAGCRISRQEPCCAQRENRPGIAARTTGETVPDRPIRLDAPLRARKTGDESTLTEMLFRAQTP